MAFECTACRNVCGEFSLLCPWCGAWLTLREGAGEEQEAAAIPLTAVMPPAVARRTTGIDRIDALLGGGFVAGSSVLLTGAPGAGKSTLLLQILSASATAALYVSGEEASEQIKMRANRLGINSPAIAIAFETNIRPVLAYVRKHPPVFCVIDSIQTMYTDASDSLPGSVTQIRKCTYVLRRLAQEKGMVLLIVGQVTKGLQAAGPKMLEHAVDVVVSLSVQERDPAIRLLSVSKNRFGPAGCSLPLCMAGGGFRFDAG
ncbi:MAG TPA: ATPase domain-containing protein [Bacteroidota bacterium]|nr:ATPase domain-containing protein [Bacteroidota bacterium]